MGRKEEMVTLIQKLMENRENIRNFGTVAHIDHGKCVSGETKIFLSNGRIIQAEKLYELFSQTGKKVKNKKDEIVFDVTKTNLEVKSFDKEKKEIVDEKITHAWKLKTREPLVKLTLSNGTSIKTTPEHKFLCLDEKGKLIEKESGKIELKDFILAPKFLEVKATKIDLWKKELLNKLATDSGFFIRVEDREGTKLKSNLMEYGMKKLWKEIKPITSQVAFFESVKKNRYRLIDFTKICGKFNLDAYNLIKEINYRKGLGKTGKNSIDVALPKTERDIVEFAYLAGVIWGDGGNCGKEIRVTSEDVEIIQEIQKICNNVLRINIAVRKYKEKATRIDLQGGLTLTKIFEKGFELPLKQKSGTIKVPTLIQNAKSPITKAFIQGYFDTDGTVERSRRAVSIYSKSKEMLEELYFELLRFRCMATFNEKKQTLYISGTNLKIFTEEIGFRLNRKHKWALKFAKLTQTNRNTDLLPLSGKMLKELRKKMGAPLNIFSKTQEVIEMEKQKVYSLNLNSYIETIHSFIGNPKIKDKKAWKQIQDIDKTFFDCNTLFVTKKEYEKEETVYDFTVDNTHNFIANGMIIHNTTLSDALIAAAGLINENLSGEVQMMDYEDQEQDRGITINAANISLAVKWEGKDFLVNLIDTPGHVDFTGEVIRAMRAVDGVVLVVDAVEGVMPQTETVLRQALREYVRPVLFINKVDRIIAELNATEQQMQEKFIKVIAHVNTLIERNAPKQFKENWKVSIKKGTVAFGSAKKKWAVSVPYMKKSGVSFKQVYEMMKNDQQDELAKKSPVNEAVMQMVLEHLPSPLEAQKYRIGKIWGGDKESEIGKAMEACDAKAPLGMVITDVSVDPHAGDVATGRLYSGTIKSGDMVIINSNKQEIKIQKMGVYMSGDFLVINEAKAGNIAAIVGAKDIYAGETLSTIDMKPFESFMSNVKPVMTISIEAKNPKDLPKLIEVLKKLSKEDPNLQATINQETGEHLLSGMGELHLEVNIYRITHNHKLDVQTSEPIVVYHEGIHGSSETLEAKSPNKHNKFKIKVSPTPQNIVDGLIEKNFEGKIKPKHSETIEKLKSMGFDTDTSRKVWAITGTNVMIDRTRGIQALTEIRELVIQAFNDAMNEGPLAKEKCQGVTLELMDATLHEDSIHRGPAQVLPAITRGIYACMLQAGTKLYEPKQILSITVPEDQMGSASRELGSRRVQITEMRQEGDSSVIIGKAPVKELIGFSSAMRSATQGRAVWTAEYYGYEILPVELQEKTIEEIRKRKGMPEGVKNWQFFIE